MTQAEHPLPVTRRCELLLELARSTAYYRPQPVSDEDLKLMRRIDEIHLEPPFYGSRRLAGELEDRGHGPVNRKRVQGPMRQMGLVAPYPKRRTSSPGEGHKVYPYRLRGLSIEHPNQVWVADICYLPMAKGFMYLVAIMDWYSRRGLSWRLSNTLAARSVSRRSRRRCRAMGRPRSSTPTRGSVHLGGVHERAQSARGGDQHGRSRSMA